MSFRVKNKQALKNYNEIWEKAEKLLKINFESKPVYGDKYIKTKITTNACSRLQVFIIKKCLKKSTMQGFINNNVDSVIKANKKYYPQTFLEECKYVQEKIKTENYIDEDLEKSESDSDSNDETESDIDNDEYDK